LVHWSVVAAAFLLAVAGLLCLMAAMRREAAWPEAIAKVEAVSLPAGVPAKDVHPSAALQKPVQPSATPPTAPVGAKPPESTSKPKSPFQVDPPLQHAPCHDPAPQPEPPANPFAPANKRACNAPDQSNPLAKSAPSQGRYGTVVDFMDDPTEAAREALKEKKLLFVLHVAGNFEDDKFT
jgi:hypothetical protein